VPIYADNIFAFALSPFLVTYSEEAAKSIASAAAVSAEVDK
jgi:hypothetical protein